MTYADFYLVLREFEQGAVEPKLSQQARMAERGLTRRGLAELARGNGSFELTPRKRVSSKPPKRVFTATR